MSRIALFLILLAALAYANAGGDGGPSDDNDDEPQLKLLASLDISCEGNTVTVVDQGADPVQGAEVDVFDEDTLEHLLDDVPTDSSGQVGFEGCGRSVRIYATKDYYTPYTLIRGLVDCDECGCDDDSNCADNETCDESECTPIDCCGIVANHTCYPYECGDGPLCPDCPENTTCIGTICMDDCVDDTDCAGDESCSGGVCKPRPGCESDSDCKDVERCVEYAEGMRICMAITGCCGLVANHTCNLYECGEGESCLQCPKGEYCYKNECVKFGIDPRLEGVEIVVDVPAGCEDCTISAIDPEGEVSPYAPDAEGEVRIPLDRSGRYLVALLDKGGALVDRKELDVLLREEPPAQKDFFRSLIESPFFWLVLLIALVAAAVFYMRGRKGDAAK